MGDVADILGLGGRRNGGGGSSAAAAGGDRGGLNSNSLLKSANKKPAGMSREVFSLLDPGALTSITPTRQPALAGADNPGKDTPCTAWRWTPFANTCRRDGLRLGHWQRAASEAPSEYQFARFNKRSYVIEYNDAAFAMIAAADAGVDANDQRKWTRADCDYLLELCNQYGLRWPVIADRWSRTPQRSALEIKSRYYRMAHLLLAIPSSTSPIAASAVSAAATAAATATAAAATSMPNANQAISLTTTPLPISAAAGAVSNTAAETRIEPAAGALAGPPLNNNGANAAAAMEVDTRATPAVGDGVQQQQQGSQVQTAMKWPESTATITAKAKGAARAELSGFILDEAQEGRRIANLDRQFMRTKEQEQEEQELLKELRTVVAKLKQKQKEQTNTAAKAVVNSEAEAHLRVAHFGAAEGLRPKRIYLRSARMLTMPTSTGLGARLIAKLSSLLTQLDVPLRPLPTALVCNAYDKLRQDAVKLLALQRFLHNKRKDLSVAKGVTMSSLMPPPSAVGPAGLASAAVASVKAAAVAKVTSGPSAASSAQGAPRPTKKSKKAKAAAAAGGASTSSMGDSSATAADGATASVGRKPKRKKGSTSTSAATGTTGGSGNTKGATAKQSGSKSSGKRPRANSSKSSASAGGGSSGKGKAGAGGDGVSSKSKSSTSTTKTTTKTSTKTSKGKHSGDLKRKAGPGKDASGTRVRKKTKE